MGHQSCAPTLLANSSNNEINKVIPILDIFASGFEVRTFVYEAMRIKTNVGLSIAPAVANLYHKSSPPANCQSFYSLDRQAKFSNL
jgi:hypothetical protein